MKLLVCEKEKQRCSLCGELIPIGHKYWQRGGGTWVSRQHTNCAEYKTLSSELLDEQAEKVAIAKYKIQIGDNNETE